jgi:N-acetylmuramoyl-L-alanine amidase
MNKIAVDPGHGMSNRRPGVFDTGATHNESGTDFHEADIALHYGLTLRDKLKAAGKSVFMTRDDNQDPTPVGQRAANAEAAGCDGFISLHLNDADDDNANGVEVLYNDDADRALAQKLQDALLKASRLKDRKIKQRPDLAVLKFKGPAALIELGFIANDKDRETLLNPQKRDAICDAIVNCL